MAFASRLAGVGTVILSGTLAARPAAAIADRYYWATDVQILYRDTGIVWQEHRVHFLRELHTEGLWGGTGNAPSEGVTRVYYSPLQIPFQLTIDRLGCVHAGVAAGNFYLGIYDSLNDAPNNRLALTALTACSGINQKQLVPMTVPTLQLNPGLHFISINVDNTLDTFALALLVAWFSQPTNVNNGLVWFMESLGAFGVPPAIAAATPYEWIHFMLYARVFSVP